MPRFYAIFATDKPDMLAVGERVRPAHRAYLPIAAAELGVHVRGGQPRAWGNVLCHLDTVPDAALA